MLLGFHSQAAGHPGYRPDIDGLRAIAVLSVVLFHAGSLRFAGGYVGVDVFFVISGYLITQIVERELSSGRFSLWTFYARRMRRILPALLTVVLVSTLAAAVLFAPQQLVAYGRSLVALSCFVSNGYFAEYAHEDGYFAETRGVQLLLHTWSLSLEEQFYVLFPVLLLLLHRTWPSRKRTALLILIAASFALSMRDVQTDRVAAFYLLRGRAWELLIGCLLALRPLPSVRSSALRTMLSGLGLASIAYAVFTFDGETVFPGPKALYPCLGAALILYAGEGGDSLVKRALGVRPLVFVGVTSYSLYLWHWPLIGLAKYVAASPSLSLDRGAEIALALGMSVVLACASFKLVEAPARSWRSGTSPRRVVSLGIGASALLVAAAVVLVRSEGLPQRYPAREMATLRSNYERKSEILNPWKCTNWVTENRTIADIHFCELGPKPRKIMFLGDSHVGQLFTLLESMEATGELGDRSILTAIAPGCLMATRLNVTVAAHKLAGFHCDRFTRFALERAAQSDVETVVVAASLWWLVREGVVCTAAERGCGRTLTVAEAWRAYAEELREQLSALRARGKRVIVVLPFPVFYPTSVPDVQIRNIVLAHFGFDELEPKQCIPDFASRDLRQLAAAIGASTYEPRQVLCPQGRCLVTLDDVAIYSDETHLAASQVDILRPSLRAALNQTSEQFSGR